MVDNDGGRPSVGEHDRDRISWVHSAARCLEVSSFSFASEFSPWLCTCGLEAVCRKWLANPSVTQTLYTGHVKGVDGPGYW
jgi:hypothetical protein